VQGLLLVDHGSRRAESNEQLDVIVSRVQRLVGDSVLVKGAHMEIAVPDISEQVAALAAVGVTDLVVVPYMLAPGRHAAADIPRLANEAAAAHPQLSVRVGQCLGVDDLLAQLTIRRAVEAGLKLG
jgi:sirohydrochlorin ferrochelatase